MKNLKRGSVLGMVFGLVMMSTVEAQAQGNGEKRGSRIGTTTLSFDYDSGGLSALRTYVSSLVSQIEQAKLKIAQLEAALHSETRARDAADNSLRNAINGMPRGVDQAALDAAIAAEAAVRSTADAALEGQIANEAAARAALAATVAPLATLTPLVPLATYVTVQTGAINGLAGPHVIFSGANVHIQSGGGDSLTATGLGNLIVGYNEVPGDAPAERGGSHNVVIGFGHRYNFGTGFVAGFYNRLGDMAASVSGGGFNEAGNFAASITGGSYNKASGLYSSVTAGDSNTASGGNAAVNGGSGNTAAGDLSAVSGGLANTASAPFSVVP